MGSRRSLPLPALFVDALRAHRRRPLEERLAHGPHWQESGFVFVSTIGTPLEPGNLNRTFDALIEKANKAFGKSDGLAKTLFHDLRHSCATMPLSRSVPQRTPMEIPGHSHISLTMNTYSHVLPEMTRGGRGDGHYPGCEAVSLRQAVAGINPPFICHRNRPDIVRR